MRRIGRGIKRQAGVMNKLEARYQGYLEEQKRLGYLAWYAFEAVKLKLADKTHWTADFCVMRPDGILEFHDTKGTTTKKNSLGERVKSAWVEGHSQIKIKVAAEKFPFRFFHVWLKDGVWQYEEFT